MIDLFRNILCKYMTPQVLGPDNGTRALRRATARARKRAKRPRFSGGPHAGTFSMALGRATACENWRRGAGYKTAYEGLCTRMADA